MKTYKTQAEVEADIKNGWLIVNDDVTFDCDVKIDANINAGDINAGDIDALDINARDIDARNIIYYAVCFAYNNITCKSISSRRENGRHFVLDGEIKIEKEK